MVLTALAKKLFRTLAKVIPQCGMASQAVAFNMFLAFFAVLLTALSFMKGKAVSRCHADFGGSSPRELTTHIRVRVTPGGEHLVPGACGWIGTLLVGSGLAAAIGLMAWMEISAMLVLVGAAWNSESATRTINLA